MKQFKIILMLLLGTMVYGNEVYSQTKSTESKNNYIVLTSNIEQLKPILITAQKLALEDGKNYGDFQLIVCGKTVENLANPEKMKAILELAENTKVKLIACGFSLNKFNVEATNIPKQFSVVENGILYDFQLQKKGYYNIGL